METNNLKILEVEHLTKEFDARRKLTGRRMKLRAVDDVSFYVKKGETFGIVGESGCGKTTLGKCIVRLHKPTAGRMYYRVDGVKKDLLDLPKNESFRMRRRIQIIFQDPYASLNPMHNILEAFDEPLRIHGFGNKDTRREIAASMLERVNLQPDYMYRYPHEFSGGQRQRICIAKALALQPDMVVCDEPVSALDVSIQAQILNLMKELQQEMDLAYIFIAHDLSVVQYMSDRIAVMYLGKIVETGTSDELYNNHLHPYTQALLSAVPVPVVGQKKQRIVLPGDIPSPLAPPSGCRFHPRCEHCMEKCRKSEPPLIRVGGEHEVACHMYASAGEADARSGEDKCVASA